MACGPADHKSHRHISKSQCPELKTGWQPYNTRVYICYLHKEEVKPYSFTPTTLSIYLLMAEYPNMSSENIASASMITECSE
jgi:hypothetical protein